MEDLNLVMKERFRKAQMLEEQGVPLYPNTYRIPHRTKDVFEQAGHKTAEELEQENIKFVLAGRIMAIRSFGKSIFMHIQDEFGRIQIYLQKNKLDAEKFKLAKKFDIGDIIYVSGIAFRTKTNELTILVEDIALITKNLRPLPEKYHGLKDVEIRYRQRYLDLIVNQSVRDVFKKRTRIIQSVRKFLCDRGFLEVETPMMQVIPGGATAKPFKTYHNALGMELYLRIAPELYLKRLLVGGFEKVFELNRNFRNEGISTQHNPEFTMLEFYEAYATYEDFMKLTEELFVFLCNELNDGKLSITYQGQEIDLTPPWKRYKFMESLETIGGFSAEDLSDFDKTAELAKAFGIKPEKYEGHGKLLTKLFDVAVEPRLIQPTFITHYPLEVSPLSRRNDRNPEFVDRFELFIAGREMANAFSELNDPRDQKERFLKQLEAKRAGDEEAHEMDEDYIRALEYGMPPAAGEGIGIDRLVMLFTDMPSIRDVILFPLLKPEK